MPDERSSRIDSIFWGIFFLFLGVVLLLQALGALPWGLWFQLWRFWPVILIAIGLRFILHHWHPWLLGLIFLALLAGSLLLAMWRYGPGAPGTINQSYAQPLGGVQSLEVVTDFAAADISMSDLAAGASSLVEIHTNTVNAGTGLNASLQRRDGSARLRLSTWPIEDWGSHAARWEIGFNPDVTLDFTVRAGVSNLEMDLSALQVSDIQLDLDAGNYRIIMPDSGAVSAYIKADVANVEIQIPASMEAQISARNDITSFTIDGGRFPPDGDAYVSSGYAGASDKLELQIDADVSRINIW